MRYIWHNGKIKPETEAKLSVYDSALMYGDMVFEMTRSFNGEHFMLQKHLERLHRSIRMTGMKFTPDICVEWLNVEALEKICHEVTRANTFQPDDEHRLMINVSRGLLPIYRDIEGVEQGSQIMVTDFPLRWTVRGFGRLYDTGVNAVVVRQPAIPARFMDPKIKHRSRLYLQMANVEAERIGPSKENWPLLLDEHGNVAEGPGDNFFIVRNGNVITPPGRDVLRGISRGYVATTLCPDLRLPLYEADFGYYDVLTAEEAFMTGTPFCILPVSHIDGQRIGNGQWPVTSSLIQQWSENVNVDIVEQIKKWDCDAE